MKKIRTHTYVKRGIQKQLRKINEKKKNKGTSLQKLRKYAK